MSEQQPRSDEGESPRRRGGDADRFAGEKDEDLRSRDVTEGAERAPHRSMFRAMGFDDEDLSSPLGATGEAGAVYVRDPFGYRVELKARV